MGDERTRDEHLDRDGTILPIDDPWWLANMPPLDFQCRCWVTEHTEQTLERYGLEETERPQIPDVEYENPRTGERITVPQGVRPGFGQRNWDSTVREVYEQRLAAARPEVRRAVKAGTPEGRLQPKTDRENLESLRDWWKKGEKVEDAAMTDDDFLAEVPSGGRKAIVRKLQEMFDPEREWAAIIDGTGRIVVLPKTDNDPKHVGFGRLWKKAEGNYVLHTHTVPVPPSPADIARALDKNTAGVLVGAVLPDGRLLEYVILRPQAGWITTDHGEVESLVEGIMAEALERVQSRPHFLEMSNSIIADARQEEAWKLMNERGILVYRRRTRERTR